MTLVLHVVLNDVLKYILISPWLNICTHMHLYIYICMQVRVYIATRQYVWYFENYDICISLNLMQYMYLTITEVHYSELIVLLLYYIIKTNTSILMHIDIVSIHLITLDKNFRKSNTSLITGIFNSLWPSDTTWRQRTWSALLQAMACCLRVPNHYMN